MKLIKVAIISVMFLVAGSVQAEDLLTIYSQALESDPELQIAGYKVGIGSAQKGQALGVMLPQINASTNWSQNKQTSNLPFDSTNHYNGTRYNVSLSQSLLDFAKFWEWRKTQHLEDQYAAENIVAQHSVMFRVVEKYFNVLEAEDQLFYLGAEREATDKQLEQAQKQYAKQLILVTDIYEIEAQLDQVKASEIEAETLVIVAKESLKELTNRDPVGLNKLVDHITYVPLEGKLEEWIEVAKSENPMLAAQVSAIEVATKNVDVQKSKHLPVVDMQMQYYVTNTGYQSANLGNNYETIVGAININVPLFSGGVTTHQMYEAQHKLSISHSEHEAKLRALIKETSDAFLSTNAAVKRISASIKALDSATKSKLALEKSFRYGDQTIGDVLHAEQAEFVAQRDLAKSKYAYIKHKMRFMQAIGMISQDNLTEINGWLKVATN